MDSFHEHDRGAPKGFTAIDLGALT